MFHYFFPYLNNILFRTFALGAQSANLERTKEETQTKNKNTYKKPIDRDITTEHNETSLH